MAKLNKMLGDVNSSPVKGLMDLIETQSTATLADWAIGEVEKHVEAIYRKAYPGDFRISGMLSAAREYLSGLRQLKDVKAMVKEANQTAREMENPAAQAAVRAAAVACSTVYLPTGALGYTFYAAAAIVYDRAGLDEKKEVYDALAAGEFVRMLESLKAAAVQNEENPVKVKWNC